MDDLLRINLNPEFVRDTTIVTNVLTAFIIGPFLAFAITQDAGIRCPLAFLRLIHRISLVIFSIVLMYNVVVIVETDRIPTTSALFLNIMILVSTLISGIRHYFFSQTISKTDHWPKFSEILPHSKTKP
jgi:Ni,Fe-hydrogenase I cytochrome b subunit